MYLLFPTHPPCFSLHFLVLAFLSITLDKSLIIFLIREFLDLFGKCFSHLWGFIIFGKYTFLSFMSCIQTTRFYLWGMYYLCTLLFIIIQWKDTLQYSSLHSCDSISILLSIFPVYACESYLSIKIYFMWFFLELDFLSLHGIRVQGCSSSTYLRTYMFSLLECIQSLIPLSRRACF